MNIFDIHKQIVENYSNYIKSFINIKNEEIRSKVLTKIEEKKYWPDPLLQFNPSFQKATSIKALIEENILLPEMEAIFKGYELYKHQEIAIRKGVAGSDFIVTSGTGSGKSLTYISTIFNYILKNPDKKGIKAIIVYPMNALINSQFIEFEKYEKSYVKETGKYFPISFKKYTGQEEQTEKDEAVSNLPDIILTNYMMLELIMTRARENKFRISISECLEFLVFDELHTYRGRQGADVAMLIRRIKALAYKNEIRCIGTSATMASGETIAEEKKAVAAFATKIFGREFHTDQIIGEKLEHTTNSSKIPDKIALKKAINEGIDKNLTVEKFKNNPLAIWLENRIALRMDRGELERNKPLTYKRIIENLSDESSESVVICEKELLNLLYSCERLTISAIANKKRESYLPFKLHQFISQTGTVYITLDIKEKRKIYLEPGYSVKIDNQEKCIYPVLFSRISGKEFICVRKEEGKLVPRNADDLPEKITKEELKGEKKTGKQKQILSEYDFPDGYILFADDNEIIWDDSYVDFLPESWKKKRKSGDVLDNFYEYRIPRKIWFDAQGNFSEMPDKYPISAWFIAAPLIVDPSCGIIYDTRTNENTKLMRIGNEGRSTATTLLSYNTIETLTNSINNPRTHKLLSFTDNRQDASLQSGHFNDFIQVNKMRSAIYFALQNSEHKSLNIFTIAEEVAKVLRLSETDFARKPSPDPTNPSPENLEALKDFLQLRIIYDLKRGWRFNLPNLEQCALVNIQYNGLAQLASKEEIWRGIELFGNKSKTERERILTQILNYFRTSYAISYHKLEGTKRRELVERLNEKLNENSVWSLDKGEKIDIPNYMIFKSIGKTQNEIFTESIGPQSNLGKYIKFLMKSSISQTLKEQEYVNYLEKILNILSSHHFICATDLKDSEDKKIVGYQLLLDKILWTPGDEKNPTPDEVRNISYSGLKSEIPNLFFQNHYKTDFTKFAKPIVGKEHTGQICNEDRKKREALFRSAYIQALFCSPTMELGIDIEELNIVHMRNVPPSPANYAQRSGRAGRSGQAAIVFTYCSSVSPHDIHYFNNSVEMVAGKVAAPNIELKNEELIDSHLNSVIFSHIEIPELKNSVADVLNMSDIQKLPVKTEIASRIERHIQNFGNEIIASFNKVLDKNIKKDLLSTYWYSENWVSSKLLKFLNDFDDSFKRWRELYQNSETDLNKALRALGDPYIKKKSPEWNIAYRNEQNARDRKYKLLNNENGNFSEFYPFRYLASAGFLPGYNFTKLPVRVFVSNGEENEFISRNKFTGLSEFGPQSLIYHNGNKFRVVRMILNGNEFDTQKVLISESSGYIYLGDSGNTINNDPINGNELKNSMVSVKSNLLLMSDCQTNKVERISCEEEERMKSGYDIQTYFYVEQGIESAKKIYLKSGGDELMRLYFAPSAKIVKINYKWRRSIDNNGFLIGKNTGFWKKEADKEIENSKDPISNVHIYTDFTSDILYIQPIEVLKLTQEKVITLQFALRKAIEQVFKIEPNEIEVVCMGNKEISNILIYENTEGSIGVLSQIAENTLLLRKVFEEIFEVCHYDLATKTDQRPDLPNATYEDLLSYYNQQHHKILNRHDIISTITKLVSCEIDNSISGNISEKIQELKENIHPKSEGERIFLEYLEKNGIVLPDFTNYNLKEYNIQPDFVYKPKTLIFMDGGIHKKNDVKERDIKQRKILKDRGFDVIVWEYETETIERLIERRKDIFRKIR